MKRLWWKQYVQHKQQYCVASGKWCVGYGGVVVFLKSKDSMPTATGPLKKKIAWALGSVSS